MLSVFATLVQAEMRRQLGQSWSYRFEMLGELGLWLIAFPMLVLTFTSVSSNYGSSAQTASLLGFLIWDLCFGVIVVTTREITEESRHGTLEPLFISPLPPLALFSTRIGVAVVLRSARTVLLGTLLAWILGLHPRISSEIVAVVSILVVGAFGLSLLVGGLVLVHKEIGSVIGIVSLLAVLATGALIPLHGMGIYFSVLKLLVPFTWGIDAIRSLVVGEDLTRPFRVDSLTWFALIIQMTLFLILGAVIFRWGCNQAREKNVLGSY